MSDLATTVPATCPRCGGRFACGAATGHCDCFELRLTDAQRAALAAQWSGCLCLACLRALADADAPQPVIGAANASG